MSVRTMARVWANSKWGDTRLLMMLAIADFADDDGNAYPAVGTLAEKCRMTSRNANHLLATLRESGELEIRLNEGPKGTNRYRIVLPGFEGAKRSAPAKSPKPPKPTSPPTPEAGFTPEASFTLKPVARTPEAGSSKPPKPTSDEPSVNHHEPPERVRATRARVASKVPLPPNFEISESVQRWADKKGFGNLPEHVEAFKLKAAAKGYVYSDWDAGFMGAVSADWAGLRKAGTGRSPLHADDTFAGCM